MKRKFGSWKEAAKAGDLLGVKLVLTELIAIVDLSKEPELAARTRIIMTYALCSFANIGSVGIIASDSRHENGGATAGR